MRYGLTFRSGKLLGGRLVAMAFVDGKKLGLVDLKELAQKKKARVSGAGFLTLKLK